LCDTGGGDGTISDTDNPENGSEVDCDAVSVDQAGECQPDPDKPCEGNPVKNPRIAPSGGWNEKGGQYGWTRSSGDQFHDGIDIKSDLNSDLFAMHGGEVVDIRKSFDAGEYKKRSYGNYVRIKSTINGETVFLRYNHLNSVGVKIGDQISAGDIIGKSGNTGNAQEKNGIPVEPHVHIRARKIVNGKEQKVDPENYMATKFNNDGSISESNCN